LETSHKEASEAAKALYICCKEALSKASEVVSCIDRKVVSCIDKLNLTQCGLDALPYLEGFIAQGQIAECLKLVEALFPTFRPFKVALLQVMGSFDWRSQKGPVHLSSYPFCLTSCLQKLGLDYEEDVLSSIEAHASWQPWYAQSYEQVWLAWLEVRWPNSIMCATSFSINMIGLVSTCWLLADGRA
jgi:hypothetical protein